MVQGFPFKFEFGDEADPWVVDAIDCGTAQLQLQRPIRDSGDVLQKKKLQSSALHSEKMDAIA
eukprot:6237511-Amphidinium_carterae.1